MPLDKIQKQMLSTEVQTKLDEIGVLTSLNTTVKTNMVGAVNEVVSSLAETTNKLSSWVSVTNYQDQAIDVGGVNEDWSPAINSAITTIHTLGKGTVVFPVDCLIKGEIHVKSGVNLLGFGSKITSNGMTTGMMIRNHNIDATLYNGDSFFTIEGLIIDGNNLSCGGIGLAHTNYVTVQNCVIRNFTGSLHCIDAPANSNLRILNNQFESCIASMMQVDEAASNSMPTLSTPNLNEDGTTCKFVLIQGNKFKGGSTGAVHLHKNGHGHISVVDNFFEDVPVAVTDDNNYSTGNAYVSIINNKIDNRGHIGSSGHGIVLWSGVSNCIISHNSIIPHATTGNGIIILDDSGRKHNYVQIIHNQIRLAGRSAIYGEFLRNSIIADNTIEQWGDGGTERYGIYVGDSDTSKVHSNVIISTTATKRIGIKLNDCEDTIADGNIIKNTEKGIYVSTTGIRQSKRISVSENLISGTTSHAIHVLGTSASDRVKNININRNKISTTYAHSIRMQYIDNSNVSNNEVLETSGGNSAISLSTFKNGTITGNICDNAVTTTTSEGIAITGSGEGYSAITGNRIKGFAKGIGILFSADNCVIVGNVLSGNTTPIDAVGAGNSIANNIVA